MGRVDTYNIFDKELLNKLKNDENACVEVQRQVYNLILHPFHFNDFTSSIKTTLNEKIAKYDKRFEGILLGYKNVKFLESGGTINFDNCFIHANIEADFYIFKPIVGQILNGIVNKKSKDHVGCLVHHIFNISLPKPQNSENWMGHGVKLGHEIQFEIIYTDFNGKLPYIKGKILHVVSDDSGISTSEELTSQEQLQNTIIKFDESDAESVPKKHKKKKHKQKVSECEEDLNINEVQEDECDVSASQELNTNEYKVNNEIQLEEYHTEISPKKSKKKKKFKPEHSEHGNSATEELNISEYHEDTFVKIEENDTDVYPRKSKKNKSKEKYSESNETYTEVFSKKTGKHKRKRESIEYLSETEFISKKVKLEVDINTDEIPDTFENSESFEDYEKIINDTNNTKAKKKKSKKEKISECDEIYKSQEKDEGHYISPEINYTNTKRPKKSKKPKLEESFNTAKQVPEERNETDYPVSVMDAFVTKRSKKSKSPKLHTKHASKENINAHSHIDTDIDDTVYNSIIDDAFAEKPKKSKSGKKTKYKEELPDLQPVKQVPEDDTPIKKSHKSKRRKVGDDKETSKIYDKHKHKEETFEDPLLDLDFDKIINESFTESIRKKSKKSKSHKNESMLSGINEIFQTGSTNVQSNETYVEEEGTKVKKKKKKT